LQRAIAGIKEMHGSEDARREVAQRQSPRPHTERSPTDGLHNQNERSATLAHAIKNKPGALGPGSG
jgi:hypothetical protein